jgi:hypothetical protein
MASILWHAMAAPRQKPIKWAVPGTGRLPPLERASRIAATACLRTSSMIIKLIRAKVSALLALLGHWQSYVY